MFVTIEGIEGSGKSTLQRSLAERLRAEGREVLLTREPGGSPVGNAIRALVLEPGVHVAPLTEALLMNAARAQHVIETILPALAAGQIVLCDRFADSTLAYQGYGRGLDVAMLRSLVAAATGGMEPDRTFLLDIAVDESRRRIGARNERLDRIEREEDAFYERTRRGFLELAASNPRTITLDATLPQERLVELAIGHLERPVR